MIDGTTVELDGRIVRFWGCEAPRENQAEARVSLAALTEIVADKTLLCLQVDQQPGYTIARCYVEQTDLCSLMVRTGHANDSLGIYAGEKPLGRSSGSKGVWQ